MSTSRYQLAPPLSQAEYERLRASVAEHGVVIPVTVDQDGNLIDGHHRRKVAAELGVDCPSSVVTCATEEERLKLAATLNADRRQMTKGQRVILGRALKEALAALAPVGRPRKDDEMVDKCPPFSDGPGPKLRDLVAEAVGLGSGRTYERGEKIVNEAEAEAPDLFEKISDGSMDLREASREMRQRKKAARVADLAARPAADLDTLDAYPLLYVDPPWRYEHAPDTARQIENHYPTMALDDLCALPVPAADNAVMFLWATSPKLAEAMRVLDAWGFTYRTCLVWVKDRVGMGYYVRQRHELLLIATRGTPETPLESARPDSVITAPRGAHSAKPEQVYSLIEGMYPHLPKVELFARNARDGWAAWGNQAAAQ